MQILFYLVLFWIWAVFLCVDRFLSIRKGEISCNPLFLVLISFGSMSSFYFWSVVWVEEKNLPIYPKLKVDWFSKELFFPIKTAIAKIERYNEESLTKITRTLVGVGDEEMKSTSSNWVLLSTLSAFVFLFCYFVINLFSMSRSIKAESYRLRSHFFYCVSFKFFFMLAIFSQVSLFA